MTERDHTAVLAEYRDAQIQARRDLESAQRSVSAIEQDLAENEARRQILVRAPQGGTIGAITAEPGQSVTPSQPVAAILPVGSELEAELYVPSRAAGFLRPGMSVRLRYQAYSYQKFGQASATIREVSNTAMRPDEFAMSSSSMTNGVGEPLYRVRAKLERQSVLAYGSEHPLRSGAVVDASVLLDTRRLYEWILEPLFTITGRV